MTRALLLAVLITTPAVADRVFVDSPTEAASGVDARTLVHLVRSAAAEQGHEVVNAAAEANSVLRPGLHRLGNAFLFSLERRANNSVHGSSQLKAREVEELDEVAKRLVRAVFAGVAANENARPTDVTIDESTKGTRRKLNRSGSVFSGGLGFLGGLGSTGPGFFFAYGKGWAMGNFNIGLGFDMTVTPDPALATAMFGDLKINATYYFLDNEISPYAEADFGYGFVRPASGGLFTGGMAVGFGGGFGFFRTYDVHLRLGARLAFLLNSALPTTPTSTSIYIGVAF